MLQGRVRVRKENKPERDGENGKVLKTKKKRAQHMVQELLVVIMLRHQRERGNQNS